jgi:hypothetical protein
LHGGKEGFWVITVNGNWRLIFDFETQPLPIKIGRLNITAKSRERFLKKSLKHCQVYEHQYGC